MKLSLVLLAACVPLSSSMTTSASPTAPAAPVAVAGSTAVPPTGESRWFASTSSATTGPQPVIAAAPAGAGWVDEAGKPLPREYGHKMRTQPASVAPIKRGRPLVVTCNDRWYLIAPRGMDEAAGTIEIGLGGNEVCPERVPFADVRVIVEFKNH